MAQISLYAGGIFNDSPLSAACTTALNAPLACDPYWLTLTSADLYVPLQSNSTQDALCSATCGASFASYHDNVFKACANDPNPWTGIPATWASDAIWSTYNRTCLKDPTTNAYCTDYIASISSEIDGGVSSLPQAQQCSPCVLSLMQQAQGTAYSNYSPLHVDDYVAVQKTCGVSFPTDVKPPIANISSPLVATSSGTNECLSGNLYTVQSGDNCQTIAASKNVATGTLQTINNIFRDCSNLIAGAQICLPQTCQTYLVNPGDTCWSIASSVGITLTTFLGYNPTINPSCTNLLSGFNVCLSPSAGTYTPTTIAGATVTKTDTFATSTIPPPGPTPFKTTPNCGKYYQVKQDDFCQLISLNASIPLALFEQINPSIDAACDNLVPGFFYCVFPTADWNATAIDNGTTTTVAPPAPTPPGTTGACFTWHVIASGDTCTAIEQQFGVTMSQLLAWNPQLNSGCSNLLLDEAYCVNGAPTSSGSGSGVPSMTVAPPAPTPPGTTGACFVWHTIVSGDSCGAMETQFGITMAQLLAWNPQLNSGCTNLLLDEAYCVDGAPTSSGSASGIPSTTVAPPAPTPPGTSGACFVWHTIVSGDTCGAMETQFGVTMAQLVEWNPQLNSGCTNLLLGEAYCVKA
ncbi:LysM domain protein [Mycena pura]|uniref:LysM domain protein n=1 Tax=Mycena pura TaxID=153505 RepID=A0AAD6VE49_9AGAR|nr:LysM domain protein [Mycena pura]